MKELPKAYESKNIESKWYQFWMEQGFFKADPTSDKPPYCIMIPPPNVTGALHMGHALVNTLQDVLIRWKRMSGFETLWMPGTDHAGISTQTVVERHLMKTTGKKRVDFSREEFLARVWEWKEENQHKIISQLQRLGCSCDWDRQRFTLDEGNNRAVRTVFKKLFDAGLIYRGDYLVNWDPVTQTAIADDEVEYEERQSFMWHLKYPLEEGGDFIHIATTRPETMLGDTAVAVSPKDPRYQHLIGKFVILPLMNRKIPIIADNSIDPEFGTGMVKVTPAHDACDYQMGLNHKLPFINIMTPDGRMNENAGAFAGLSIDEARDAVVKAMKQLGFLEKVEPHVNRVGVSYRSKATIQPYMSKQWFVKMSNFAEVLRNLVEHEKVKLIPEHWKNTYFHWIDNLRDWCISRQLWWGHRIPIWYHRDNPARMICYEGEGVPTEVKANPEEWKQDEDVLDTWFSSALWPFATLGWPEDTPELRRFYPTSVLVTGHDILFFWVARMLFMGDYFMKQPPFPETFLHGLIFAKSYWRNNPGGGITYVTEEERHEYELGKPLPPGVEFRWEKMSKSKGNIIDPIEIIDEYGTDAMRMALCASSPQMREIDLDRRKFEEFKNFANKLWNGARFVFMNLEGLTAQDISQGLNSNLFTLEDRWILSVLNRTVANVHKHLSEYAFDQAALEAYDFYWKEFCAYYVEIVKPVLSGKSGTEDQRKNKQKLLVIILSQALRLLHPMAPFITEELFSLLQDQFAAVKPHPQVDAYTKDVIKALQSPACMMAPYPQVVDQKDINPQIEQAFELVQKMVYSIRNIRGEMKIPPSVATDVHIVGLPSDPEFQVISKHTDILNALVRAHSIALHTQEPSIGFSCVGPVGGMKVMIPLPAEMLQNEQNRLSKEQQRLLTQIEKSRLQLDNTDFVNRAPPALIEKHKAQLSTLEKELDEVNSKLTKL